MAASVRTQRVARMLHKTLGEIFVQETPRLLAKVMVTVTEVRISPDLGMAKVYLSFILDKDRADLLTKIEQKKSEFRKLLGSRLGNKLRKVPELQFYIDDSVERAAKTNRLLDGLDISKDIGFMEDEV